MRLFVGIPLAAAVMDELTAAAARLRSKDDALRWAAVESWHITLQFLGNTRPEQYECLIARLSELRSRPVPIRLGELGFFDRAGIFYTGVALSPELVSLQRRVVTATSKCGFVPEARPYHPHITLARARGEGRGRPLRSLEAKIDRQPSFSPFTAAEFLLYESHLSRTGSIYEVRHRFPLTPAPSP